MAHLFIAFFRLRATPREEKRREEKRREEKRREEKRREEKRREEKRRGEERREEKRREALGGFREGSRRVLGGVWEGSGTALGSRGLQGCLRGSLSINGHHSAAVCKSSLVFFILKCVFEAPITKYCKLQ